jgi:hypothetical protein
MTEPVWVRTLIEREGAALLRSVRGGRPEIYRPELLNGFLAHTGLSLQPLSVRMS